MTLPSRARRNILAALVLALLLADVLVSPDVVLRTYTGPPAARTGALTAGALQRLADPEPVVVAPALVPPPVIAPAPAPRVAVGPAPVVPRIPAVRAARTAAPPRHAPGWEQRHGEEALRWITYPWREMGWRISFHQARRGVLGLAYQPDRHIYVFVRKDQSIATLAFTIAHEIGHAFDFTYGTRERRDRWRQLRGIDPAERWTGCEGCSDLATPAGDFAEVFAVWQVGPIDYRSRMAPLPSGERLRFLAREFGGA